MLFIIFAVTAACASRASAQDQGAKGNPALLDDLQAIQADIEKVDEMFLGSRAIYWELLDYTKKAGLAGEQKALEQYAVVLALAGRNTDEIKELRAKSGARKIQQDLAARFQDDALIGLSPEKFNPAMAAIQNIANANKDNEFVYRQMMSIYFELSLEDGFAASEQACIRFDKFIPRAEEAIAHPESLKDAGAPPELLAVALVVMAYELGQNTQSVDFYNKYEELIKKNTEPKILETLYKSLIHSYTVLGNDEEAAKFRAALAALTGDDDKSMYMSEEKIAKSNEEYMTGSKSAPSFSMDEMEGGSGSLSGGGGAAIQKIVKVTISNISKVQYGDLVQSFWEFPQFISPGDENFSQNIASFEVVLSPDATAESFAEFLNSLQPAGFLLKAIAGGEDAVTAQALGIAKQQFDVMLPFFEYVIPPDTPVPAADTIALIRSIREAYAAPAELTPYRALLYTTAEVLLSRMAGDYEIFGNAPPIGDETAKEYPASAGFCAALRALGNADTGRFAASLDNFTSAQKLFGQSDKFPALSRLTDANVLSASLTAGKVDNPKLSTDKLVELVNTSIVGYDTLKLRIVLANYYYFMADYDKAYKAFDDADAAAQGFAKSEKTRALILLGKGNCSIMMKKHDQARQAYSEAAKLAESSGAALTQAAALSHLAQVDLFVGDYAGAEEAAGKAGVLADKFADDNIKWQSLFTLARALEGQDKLDKALETYLSALKIIEVSTSAGENGGPASLPLDAQDAYRYAVALCARMNKPDVAVQIMERGNSLALKEQFEKSSVAFNNPKTRNAASELGGLKTEIKGLESGIRKQEMGSGISQAPQQGEGGLKEKLQDSQRKYIKYISDLESSNKGLASLYKIEPIELVKARKKLPTDMAVIYYLLGEDKLYIFYVRSDSIGSKEVPLDAANFEAQVKLYRNFISRPPEEGASGAGRILKMTQKVSGKLYDLLIKPIEPELKGIKDLAIIPNGILNFIPYEALTPTDGTERFLIDKYAIFYMDSLAVLEKEAPAEPRKSVTLYAFGNADQTLPAAEQEVNEISKVFKNSEVFIRKDATEEKAKELSDKGGIFHFATHGMLDFKDISQSYILLAPDAGDDGRFTIEEVWGYWWGDSTLVALSACNTAQGEITARGKAVHPASAFLNAGAPSVLATLWSVDDQATAKLMETFYKNLSSMKKIDALRAAQLELLKDPRTMHPYYWAPFTLIGDWR